MVFIDSNIPMYLIGAEHPHKHDARQGLERLIAEQHRLVSDAEVLQEILHRYVAINRLNDIQPAFRTLLGIVDEIFPVDQAAVMEAKDFLLGVSGISARDSLHVAVMKLHGVEEIFSFDRGFDRIPEIRRIT